MEDEFLAISLLMYIDKNIALENKYRLLKTLALSQY